MTERSDHDININPDICMRAHCWWSTNSADWDIHTFTRGSVDQYDTFTIPQVDRPRGVHVSVSYRAFPFWHPAFRETPRHAMRVAGSEIAYNLAHDGLKRNERCSEPGTM